MNDYKHPLLGYMEISSEEADELTGELYNVRSPQLLEEKAAAKGLVLRLANEYELFIDLDSPAALVDFQTRFLQFDAILEGGRRISEHKIYESSTPGHFHVIVKMHSPMTELEQVALQAILGSDVKRELLAYLRLQLGIPVLSCFFDKKEVIE